MKGVEHLRNSRYNFFERNDLLELSVDGLPDDSVGALAELLDDLELLEDVGLYFFSHRIIITTSPGVIWAIS